MVGNRLTSTVAETVASQPSAVMAAPSSVMGVFPASAVLVSSKLGSSVQKRSGALGSASVTLNMSPSQTADGAVMVGVGSGWIVKVLVALDKQLPTPFSRVRV